MQVNTEKSVLVLKSDCTEEHWKPGESLFRKLEALGIVKEVFPLHGTIHSYMFIVVKIQTLKKIIYILPR